MEPKLTFASGAPESARTAETGLEQAPKLLEQVEQVRTEEEANFMKTLANYKRQEQLVSNTTKEKLYAAVKTAGVFLILKCSDTVGTQEASIVFDSLITNMRVTAYGISQDMSALLEKVRNVTNFPSAQAN